jgi:hypothetical protein
MSKPTIAIPTVSPEEVDHLAELRRTVRRVHKSVPAHSPVRRASADLSEQLQRLHRRGIPLHTLAEIVGLSHQAVRVRVRTADTASQNGTKPPRSVVKAPKLSAPTAGVHRRLHLFDPPEDAGPAYLAMLPSIPLLKDRGTVVDWLETQSEERPSTSTASATRLRVPPAVYLPRGIVDSVLVPLTTEER